MATRMLKYPIGGPDDPVDMPVDAQVKHVAVQNGVVTLWAEVNEKNTREDRFFSVMPTGAIIDDKRVYIGTAIDGPFVWHVYEKI